MRVASGTVVATGVMIFRDGAAPEGRIGPKTVFCPSVGGNRRPEPLAIAKSAVRKQYEEVSKNICQRIPIVVKELRQ